MDLSVSASTVAIREAIRFQETIYQELSIYVMRLGIRELCPRKRIAPVACGGCTRHIVHVISLLLTQAQDYFLDECRLVE